MLDYDKLSLEFDNLLEKVTKEKFEAWMAMDDLRALLTQMKKGEKVKIINNPEMSEITKINYEKPTFNVGFSFSNNLVFLQYGTREKQGCYFV